MRVYNFRNKLDYFVMNNVFNNDIMMRAIAQNLKKVDGIHYDSVEHRLRCLDHIINLVVQIFLFDKHFNSDIDNTVNISFNEELKVFRKYDSLSKLHNINVFIMRDNKRIQKFKQLTFKHHMFRRDHQIR